MPKRLPLSVGEQFGDWKVISGPRKRFFSSGRGYWAVLAECKCGTTKEVPEYDLKNKKTSRCKKCAYLFPSGIKHGMCRSSEYNSWRAMIVRCYDVLHIAYHNYGGRGVVVCDHWNPAAGGSFENFYADMGPKPSKDHELDKEAVLAGNKVYGPDFVKWAPRKSNIRRRSNSVFINFDGERIALVDLACKFSVNYGSLYWRIIKKGASPEAAIKELVELKNKSSVLCDL